MKKGTRIVTAAVVFVLAAAAIAAAVYAYLQNREEMINELTIGEDKVTVEETFPTQPYQNMSDEFTKKVSVRNTGTSDQYVRMYLDFSDSTVRDRAKIVYAGATGEDAEGVDWSGFIDKAMTTGINGWVYIPESDTGDGAILGGYFYYTEILKPAQEATESSGTPDPSVTGALIEKIITNFGADAEDKNTDKITDFDVIVYTESVQTVEPGTGEEYVPQPPASGATEPPPWKTAWINFLTRPTE